jgi:hypothetical protein
LAAIAAGIGNQPPVGRPPFGGGAKQPTGKQPAPPSGKPGVPPPAGKQGATPPPPAGQGVGALPGPAAQKLGAIKTDLAALKKLIEEFNLYFVGDKGVWDQKCKSLEEVWRKKEMTKDPETRQLCGKLQSDMQREAGTIESNLKLIKVAAKGAPIPFQKQLDELAKELLAFKASLSHNKPDSYKKSSLAILNTKIP